MQTTYAWWRRTHAFKTKSTKEELSSITTPAKEEYRPFEDTHQSLPDWLEPIPTEVETRHRKHTDKSHDPRYDRTHTTGDSECTEAPTRIPE